MSITKAFVLDGESYFAIGIPPQHRVKGVQEEYVFRVQFKEGKEWEDQHGNIREGKDQWFVSFLMGEDKWKNYKYLGCLVPETGVVRTTEKSIVKESSYTFIILQKILKATWANNPSVYESHGFTTHNTKEVEPEEQEVEQEDGLPVPF